MGPQHEVDVSECYFCTRELRRGHWPLCPVLDMSRARRQTFFGLAVADMHSTGVGDEETSPGNRAAPTRGFLQGDRLV